MRIRVFPVILALLLSVLLVACGGSSKKSPTPSVISVSVTAASSTVTAGGTLQLTATVTGTTNTAVSWAVQETGGGTVSATGLYTAPATAGAYHVTATSQANTSYSGIFTVTVVEPVVVNISAASAQVFTGETDQFTATVTGTTNTAVTWSVQETGGGTISATGLYTAPATAGTYHVIATSQADATVSASYAVAVVPSVVVTVSAAASSVYANLTDQFSVTVANTTNQAVTWSVQEADGGTITTAGLYTAPAKAGSFHVVATSEAQPSQSSSYEVAVTIPDPSFTSTPDATLAEGTASYDYTADATDPSGTAVTYALTSGPATATLTGAALAWTPAASELLMPTSFTITATTALGGTATQNWTVTPYRAVTVSAIDNFWTSSGAGASTLTGLTISAVVPGASTLAAVDNVDGTYTIHNVPAGYYWLLVGTTDHYWTNVSTFDLGTDYLGRQTVDAGLPTVDIPVTIGDAGPPATGLTIDTFASGHSIWIGSLDANSWYAPTTQPVVGVTSYVDLSDSVTAKTIPALTAADQGYVLQYEWGSTGNTNYQGLSITTSQTQAAGFLYSTPITGALAAGTSYSFPLTLSGWPSLVAMAGSGATESTFFGAYAWPMPYATAPTAAGGGGMPSCLQGSAYVPCATGFNGWPTGSGPEPAALTNAPRNHRQSGSPAPLFAAWAERCQYSGATVACNGATEGEVVTLGFNSPFPSSWPWVVWSQQEVSVPVAGVTQSFTAYSDTALEFTTAPTAATTITPLVTPVTGATINDADLYVVASPTAPLVLSWTAPTLSSGARMAGYTVLVYAVPASGYWGSPVARLFTTSTTMTVPTGLLAAGSYVFVIESEADATADMSAAPRRSGYPNGRAQTVSAPMTITGS